MRNAYGLDKADLYKLGAEDADEFRALNGFSMIDMRDRVIPTIGKPQGSYGCGVYLPRIGQIVVNSTACAKPSQGQARQWSFPGYSTDRTPVGVVAHEMGHYVDHCLGYPSRGATFGKRTITSYEPNDSESFAETVRLFITNPALLRAGWPDRYYLLTGKLGLKPRPKAPMTDALAQLVQWGASEAILRVASNKARA